MNTLFHQTDLFRPHNDPDDHWDLACAFAIAKKGLAKLAAVLIDFPPGPPVLNHASDPDVSAVAQLSHLSGIHCPIAIGNPQYFSARAILDSPPPTGVEFIVGLLRQSSNPVSISIVGSARDIADAIAREPNLFAEKCARIYLVAGSGRSDLPSVQEWNVALDPAAYAQIFQARCPIYWLPCLDEEDRVASLESRPYAGHFQFQQKAILDWLPPGLRNYFGFMYERKDSSFWLRALREDFSVSLHAQRDKYRMMYSTPLFFDVSEMCVTRAGKIRPKTENRDDWVYRFEPIDVRCTPDGITRWKPTSDTSNRHIMKVLDPAAYPQAMTIAMRSLLIGAFQ